MTTEGRFGWLRELFRIRGVPGKEGTEGTSLGPAPSEINPQGTGVNTAPSLESGKSGGSASPVDSKTGKPIHPLKDTV